MAFYQVFFFTENGSVNSDILLQEKDIKEARRYAKHRIDGSYGETEYVKAEVKRISLNKAIEMFNGNPIMWVNDYSLLEGY